MAEIKLLKLQIKWVEPERASSLNSWVCKSDIDPEAKP